jgi:hypothetical protein
METHHPSDRSDTMPTIGIPEYDFRTHRQIDVDWRTDHEYSVRTTYSTWLIVDTESRAMNRSGSVLQLSPTLGMLYFSRQS